MVSGCRGSEPVQPPEMHAMPIKTKTGILLRAGAGGTSARPLHHVVLPQRNSAIIDTHTPQCFNTEVPVLEAHPSSKPSNSQTPRSPHMQIGADPSQKQGLSAGLRKRAEPCDSEFQELKTSQYLTFKSSSPEPQEFR